MNVAIGALVVAFTLDTATDEGVTGAGGGGGGAALEVTLTGVVGTGVVTGTAEVVHEYHDEELTAAGELETGTGAGAEEDHTAQDEELTGTGFVVVVGTTGLVLEDDGTQADQLEEDTGTGVALVVVVVTTAGELHVPQVEDADVVVVGLTVDLVVVLEDQFCHSLIVVLEGFTVDFVVVELLCQVPHVVVGTVVVGDTLLDVVELVHWLQELDGTVVVGETDFDVVVVHSDHELDGTVVVGDTLLDVVVVHSLHELDGVVELAEGVLLVVVVVVVGFVVVELLVHSLHVLEGVVVVADGVLEVVVVVVVVVVDLVVVVVVLLLDNHGCQSEEVSATTEVARRANAPTVNFMLMIEASSGCDVVGERR